jgi:hypothetical protein
MLRIAKLALLLAPKFIADLPACAVFLGRLGAYLLSSSTRKIKFEEKFVVVSDTRGEIVIPIEEVTSCSIQGRRFGAAVRITTKDRTSFKGIAGFDHLAGLGELLTKVRASQR